VIIDLSIAHANRPTYTHLVDECLKKNYALVCLDFHGHGYSEGTRAYVEEQCHLLDDATSIIRAVYHPDLDLHECHFNEHPSGHHKHVHRNNSKKVATQMSTSSAEPVFGLCKNKVPFFVMGQSMGGAVSIRLGLYYQELAAGPKDYQSEDADITCIGGMPLWTASAPADLHKSPADAEFAALFSGAILLAPAITSNLPPPLVRMVFENVLVPFFPETSIPKAMSGGVDDYSRIWNSEKFIEYSCVKDKHHPVDNPHGLSFGDNIRFKTAHTLVQMMQTIQGEMQSISFPFIIFHDPEDAVTQFAGSLRVLTESSTPSDKKCLYSLPDAKHDLFTNRLSVIVKKTLEWINI
jgi:alpha-beta hydrolase superfamily lysophospholipase